MEATGQKTSTFPSAEKGTSLPMPPVRATESPTTTATNLGSLLQADLGFHGSDGKYATHGWHPFPAKFPPQLPQHFIKSLSSDGETVLDPMLGSGTTLVEAQRLGRQAVGCDIDPLAQLMATAKLTPLDPIATLRAGRTGKLQEEDGT